MSRLDIFKAAGLEKKLVEAPAAPPSEVLEDKNALTKKDIQDALPAQLKVKVSDELVSKVNSIAMDPMIAEEIRNNFIGFHHVLKDGKFKIEQYLEACAYVTYKMMGYTNQDAYACLYGCSSDPESEPLGRQHLAVDGPVDLDMFVARSDGRVRGRTGGFQSLQ